MAHVSFQMIKNGTKEVGFGTAVGHNKDGLHIRITVAVYDPGMNRVTHRVFIGVSYQSQKIAALGRTCIVDLQNKGPVCLAGCIPKAFYKSLGSCRSEFSRAIQSKLNPSNLLTGFRVSRIFVAFARPSVLPGTTKNSGIHGALQGN